MEKIQKTNSQYEISRRRSIRTYPKELDEKARSRQTAPASNSEPDTKRYYQHGAFLSAVLGYVGSDNNGAYGLESEYNDELAGTAGRLVRVQNAQNKDIMPETQQYIPATDGNSLVLTIDSDIQNYLETGEPVGSRTISKYSDLKLSSATIRNEMSDLEELGYIIQPHTIGQAGFLQIKDIVSMWISLIHEKETEVTQVRDMVIQRVDRVELLLKQMAKLLASNTNYATLISGPQYHQTKIKFIQLSRVETGKLLIVTVLEGNIIKNSIVTLDAELTDEDILNLNILLNSGLNGLTMEQINLDVITRMKGRQVSAATSWMWY